MNGTENIPSTLQVLIKLFLYRARGHSHPSQRQNSLCPMGPRLSTPGFSLLTFIPSSFPTHLQKAILRGRVEAAPAAQPGRERVSALGRRGAASPAGAGTLSTHLPLPPASPWSAGRGLGAPPLYLLSTPRGLTEIRSGRRTGFRGSAWSQPPLRQG